LTAIGPVHDVKVAHFIIGGQALTKSSAGKNENQNIKKSETKDEEEA
jgi:hypothetical protein